MSRRTAIQAVLRVHLENVRENLSTGVSLMVPFVTIGGIFLALGYAWATFFGVGIQRMSTATGSVSWFFSNMGQNGLAVMIPVLGGAIAYSIAGRPGIAPGFMLSQIIQDGSVLRVTAEVIGLEAASSGAGYLGALVVGLVTGHVTCWLKNQQMPSVLGTAKPFIIVPVGATLLLFPVVLFAIGVPVALARLELMQLLSGIHGGQALVVGTVLGSMMAFDMGGPVNKVAYVFSFELSLYGITEPMAAVMIAGMTPPIGMALANYYAPEKYSEELYDNARSSVLLGFAFVTEGAIPYAAEDPLRVIPGLMAGSAVAASASLLLEITMPAPHGGIFVIPLSNAPLLFLAVILFGSVITAVAVTALKPEDERVRSDNTNGAT